MPDIELDLARSERCGFPEFVYGKGKTLQDLLEIIEKIASSGENVLITKLNSEFAEQISASYPEAVYDKSAEIFFLEKKTAEENIGNAVIITAGTTDIPVAREAFYTLKACRCNVNLIADAGVAGLHRLLNKIQQIKEADVLIVIAGMEGALPSVVAGLVPCPIIAVPTSVGYGTAFGGVTALLAMLNSCANGVTVTNIDNGFGAACAAARIINSKYKK
jgi:NCAIR mutase (PurE)-related protein